MTMTMAQTSPVDIVNQVNQAHRVFNDMGGEVAARFALFVGEMDVINVLGKIGSHRMGQMARRLLISPPNATRIVKQLEEKGLVHRSRSEASDREVIVRLTEEGSKLYNECFPQIACEAQARFDTALSPEEQSTLLTLLQKLNGKGH